MATHSQKVGKTVEVPNLTGLSEEERQQVIAVIQRAQEFEDEESRLMRRPLEGQLTKFTNVVKGWLPRWFVLEPETGMLEYFEKEEHKKLRPRGSVYLAGAVVCPSDEDSQTFSVHASNGEIIRIRAQDAKGRQMWVDRLRVTAEYHTASLSKSSSLDGSGDVRTLQSPGVENIMVLKSNTDQTTAAHRPPSNLKYRPINTNLPESLKMVKEHQLLAEDLCTTLHTQISEFPVHSELGRYDSDLLLLKATSAAALRCVSQCFSTLKQQHVAMNNPSVPTVRWYGPKTPENVPSYSSDDLALPDISSPNIDVLEPVQHETEVEDLECYKDTELGGVDEHKTVILNLLSQLKLGMDLTKVVLPTFILERRSLLEMFADCMAHPHLFLRIANYETPEMRMIAVLRWYLSSFHAGRQGSIAKKPYNPIIGEVFRCSWQLTEAQLKSEDVLSDDCDIHTPPNEDIVPGRDKVIQMAYCAEQVSHHPPISAFYCECPDQQISLNAAIWTKSKFTGMSIGVEMIGPLTIRLLSLDEEYTVTLPSVFARSILTVPWVEMGDRLNISCTQTGYSAAVTFHTKPFYGGKLHRVTAEVKSPSNSNHSNADNGNGGGGGGGNIVCRVQGEWNTGLDFNYTDGRKETMDVAKLAVFKKRVCPLNLQKDFESRKLWDNVTRALEKGDKNEATQHKHFLEERQRQEEKRRRENDASFPTKFFKEDGETWTFKKNLKKDQTTFNI